MCIRDRLWSPRRAAIRAAEAEEAEGPAGDASALEGADKMVIENYASGTDLELSLIHI